MNKHFKFSTLVMISILLLFTLVGSVQAAPRYNRFAGQDRFQTSISIAGQEFQGQQVSNVILASAYSFPDALAASSLSTKLQAPIILVGTNMHDSQVSLDFIRNHLASGGTVTIVGGAAVVPRKVEDWLLNAGYTVTRLGGNDRFATDALIVKNLSVTTGTAIVVASGYDFPDALGVASIAASKGWPILLSGPNQLPQTVKDFVTSDQPSDIYIVGGKFILHDSIQTELQTAAPNAQIQRFGGQDRFDTLSQILYKFYPNPTQIYLANGFDFADALSGSTLAAQNNSPILLVDPKARALPPAIRDYLITLRTTGVTPQVNVLGGSVGLPDWVVNRVNEILGGGNTNTTTTPSAITVPTTDLTTDSSNDNEDQYDNDSSNNNEDQYNQKFHQRSYPYRDYSPYTYPYYNN
ncbi:cell wall-binding protein [Desulfosporosinus acidiphilus SJ4]|uniref:Cell wall-binding protein n=1 Tax=Desulfosporosinus acidiphilus (strain DSM 22704 / JCM 16185 / SJ4) TaxID=646529 RepID=I4D2B2_DESAJ|nr:cell wall-binding repeat-containing protein [Desulfosporosinus acidiphilus]AFM39936.1 cell wall-binding protein [Desulfosporosinus acidiphilus SJ4]